MRRRGPGTFRPISKRVLLVTDSHGRELHHLLENNSDYNVTAIISPNGNLNYVMDNALLYKDKFDMVVVMAGTNDIDDRGYIDNSFFTGLGKLLCLSKEKDVFFIGIPLRKDRVCKQVLKSVRTLNNTLKSVSRGMFSFTSLYNLKRYHFTGHGLHLNISGKYELVAIIINVLAHGQYEFFSFGYQTFKQRQSCRPRRRR